MTAPLGFVLDWIIKYKLWLIAIVSTCVLSFCQLVFLIAFTSHYLNEACWNIQTLADMKETAWQYLIWDCEKHGLKVENYVLYKVAPDGQYTHFYFRLKQRQAAGKYQHYQTIEHAIDSQGYTLVDLYRHLYHHKNCLVKKYYPALQ